MASKKGHTRQPITILLVGARGTGKTTLAEKIAKAAGRRVLWYQPFEVGDPRVMEMERLKESEVYSFTGSKAYINEDSQKALDFLFRHYRNGTLILDDCAHFLQTSRNKASHGFNQIVASCRHLGLDVLCVFHNLNEVPTYVYNYANTAYLFNQAADPKNIKNVPQRDLIVKNWNELQTKLPKDRHAYVNFDLF